MKFDVFTSSSYYFVAYCLLHAATVRTLRAKGFASKDIHIVAEKLPSTVNAIATSSMALWLLFKDIAFANQFAFTFYDIIAMLSTPETAHFSSWAHHIFGIVGVGLTRLMKVGAYFPACFLPPELTVVASNLLYLAQKYYPDNSDLIGMLLALRCAIFTAVRLPAAPLCLLHAVASSSSDDPVESTNSSTSSDLSDHEAKPYHHTSTSAIIWRKVQNFTRDYSKLPLIVKVGSAFNIFLFTGLNTYWTILTYKAFFRYLAGRKARTLTKSGNVHHI
ncbi:hypothetical protein HK100_010894 [Physocladia obscura]|uniref:TLC domain-containing protein n=1 Tax=Physocladia obscura TaxID=109957 RepID=A0AAD5XHZ6_9FUNG|nr:hypothetical protein HK100_010894 [Physocladia obscura]